MTLGRLFREARERKGLSRTKLAEFIGVRPNSMIRYERAGEEGGKPPSGQNIMRIARELEIDPCRVLDALQVSDDFAPEKKIRFANLWWTLNDPMGLSREREDETSVLHLEDRLSEKLDKLQADMTALRATIESGSDQSDPSRPSSSTTRSKAVPVASSHDPKKEIEDDDPE